MQSESILLESQRPLPLVRALAGTPAALLVTCAFGILYACVARYVLHAFPFAGDEYSVVLQSKLFAHGTLRAPAPPHAEWLEVDHVILEPWVRSKYPLGMAALLAVGERFGASWLVNPLLGVATLLVVWPVIRRTLGETPAIVGLVMLALAPLFAFHAASFFSHTAAGLFLAVAFAAVASWLEREVASERSGGSGWFVLCGAALGCAFLVRPFDAVLFGVAMLSLRSMRAILVTAASALPFVAISLVYQWAQYGSLLVDGYTLVAPRLGKIYGPTAGGAMLSLGCAIDPLQTWFHIDVLRAFVVDWTVPGAVLVAVFGAYAIGKEHPARRLRTFCLALIGLSLFALLFTKANPDDGARPRYLAPLLVPLAFLGAAGYAPACAVIDAQFGRLVRQALVVVTLFFGLGNFAAFLQGRVPQMWKREGVYVAAESEGLRDAVVVVRAQYPNLYARNGPWFDGVLYLSAPATTTVEEIAAAYPGRSVWEAWEGEKWRLVKFR
ncbi:MAG TPA: glycosyltransferase family 39 protein [Polyangiaceae bacterium]|jgi:4-amino-4-deoxy-L-arabinose transferase-like glycosyltransferase